MPGERLDRKWRSLTLDQKRVVMRTLRHFVEELRAIPQPSPPGWIGTVSRQAGVDVRVEGEIIPAFDTEALYIEWRISTFAPFAERSPSTAAALQETRQAMRADHRICFTHGDIAPRNILISLNAEGPTDVEVVALVDWEQAGWRPEFWETAKFSYGLIQTSEWAQMAREEIFTSYDEEMVLEVQLLLLSGPPR